MPVLGSPPGNGAQPDVEILNPVGTERGVGGEPRVENRDRGAAAPVAPVARGAEKGEGFVAERHLVDCRAILLRGSAGEVDQWVGADGDIIGGVQPQLVLQRGEPVVAHPDAAEPVEPAQHGEAGGAGALEKTAERGFVLEREEGFPRPDIGTGQHARQGRDQRLRVGRGRRLAGGGSV